MKLKPIVLKFRENNPGFISELKRHTVTSRCTCAAFREDLEQGLFRPLRYEFSGRGTRPFSLHCYAPVALEVRNVENMKILEDCPHCHESAGDGRQISENLPEV